jgi:hypothetical protein
MDDKEIALLHKKLADLAAAGKLSELKKPDKKEAVGLRRNLYEHVTLSVRTLDIIIAVCAVFIAASIIISVVCRRLS